MSAHDRPSGSYNRRTFLRGTAATAAGLWLAGSGRHGWGKEEDDADLAQTLHVHTKSPMNAEPALDTLCESWITPLDQFYVRSHCKQVPQVDPGEFRITIEGLVEDRLELSLEQLQKEFRRETATATLTCAGNRRSRFEKKASGVQWSAGAVGNARWTGVRLSTLLKKAGLKDEAKHVWFESVDRIHDGNTLFPFGGSIPLDKAMDEDDGIPGALLAYEMNEKPLPPHHGFPVRGLVPGYIGARSVKWLGRIIVSNRPSNNHYMTHAYRLIQEDTEAAWKQAEPIGRYPINGAICEPAADAQLDAGTITVRGYALPSGGAGTTIKSVRVSADGGNTWTDADLKSPSQQFAWQLWQARLRVTDATDHLLMAATDSAGEELPQSVPWNLKGYLYNARDKVPVKVR